MKQILITMLCFLSIKAMSQCNNITNPGIIGNNQTILGGSLPETITNIESPSGGDENQPIEYIWLSTTDSLTTVGITWDVNMVSFSGDNYQPNYLNQTTWFRRCARRMGCSSYNAESNWIRVGVYNLALPINIISFESNSYRLNWNITDCNYIIVQGGYGNNEWDNLYTTKDKDYYNIENENYTHYRLKIYDENNQFFLSKTIYIRRNIINNNSLIGVDYMIFNINGSLLELGIYKAPIKLEYNQIIRFY